MHRHRFDGGGVEQVHGVGHRGPQALVIFKGVQVQVEWRGMVVPGQGFDPQTGTRALVGLRRTLYLVVEHHLEQRVVAQAALGLQGFYQLFVGQVLVGLGLHCRVLDLSQQLTHGLGAIDLGLEHLGVDEKADQPLALGTVAAGHRHADTDIGLPAVAVQQHLE